MKLRCEPVLHEVEGQFWVRGYYIWTDDDGESGSPIPRDEAYDEHLDFLCFHPGFEAEVTRLRAADRLSSGEIDRVAGKWAMTASDLRRFVDAEGGDVTLEPMADKVFVEIGATEYLVRIPRPLAPARREAVTRWLQDAWRWPRLLQDERGEGLGWRKPRSAHAAPTAREHRVWYARWNAGESVSAIWDSLPPKVAAKVHEHFVRNTLQAIHRRMYEISPEGLKSTGP